MNALTFAMLMLAIYIYVVCELFGIGLALIIGTFSVLFMIIYAKQGEYEKTMDEMHAENMKLIGKILTSQ